MQWQTTVLAIIKVEYKGKDPIYTFRVFVMGGTSKYATLVSISFKQNNPHKTLSIYSANCVNVLSELKLICYKITNSSLSNAVN